MEVGAAVKRARRAPKPSLVAREAGVSHQCSRGCHHPTSGVRTRCCAAEVEALEARARNRAATSGTVAVPSQRRGGRRAPPSLTTLAYAAASVAAAAQDEDGSDDDDADDDDDDVDDDDDDNDQDDGAGEPERRAMLGRPLQRSSCASGPTRGFITVNSYLVADSAMQSHAAPDDALQASDASGEGTLRAVLIYSSERILISVTLFACR